MSFRRVLILCVVIPFIVFSGIFSIGRWRENLHDAETTSSTFLTQNVHDLSTQIESHFSLIEEICDNATMYLGKNISAAELAALNENDFIANIKTIGAKKDGISAVGFALRHSWDPANPRPIFLYAIKKDNSGDGQNFDVLDLSHTEYTKEDWFVAIESDPQPRWDDPFMFSQTGHWIFTYTIPIMADGRFYGMLCVDTRADWYAELINRSAAELGEGAFCAVIDREGKYVLHPDLKKVKSGANLFADDIVPSGEADTASAPEIRQRRDLKIDKVLLKSGNAGIPHFMILAPLDTGKDYSLAVFLPEETLTGPIRKRLSLGLAMMLAATILAAAVAVVILHFVLTPLRQSIQTAERIARGDLELVAKMSRFREFNTLFDAFNRMILAIRSRTAAMETSIADLDGILRQVAALSQELLRVASNVSAHSQELSAGATEQSSVFQEISKAASRLEAHARSNAELAGNTNRIIEQVERTATDGNQRMRQLSEAMQEISGITESINTALKAIDVIAFQTNILALNAAVEAARAGSHGRGFNVVASEVRQLANRSAQSVVSTTETLRESAAKVQVGLDMGEKTMTALEEIERIATDAAQLMRKVTEQAADQSRIISEVLAGLEQVMEVAKRNVDSASTNAAVSEKLLSLSSQISVFLSKTHRIPSENRDDKATPHPDPNQPAANTRRRE